MFRLETVQVFRENSKNQHFLNSQRFNQVIFFCEKDNVKIPNI